MGGAHYYFLCQSGVKLKAKLGAGVDLKSEGGYVIAPPSIHPDTGLSYEWDELHNLLEGAFVAALPQWIVDMCAYETPATVLLPAQRASIVVVDDDTVRDLRSALMSMRADDRDLWVRMGLALRELGDVGRGLWMEWSSQSEKFDPPKASKTWESFK
ncbi:MAG: PriCT-2 domain-containing protein [Aestuariivirga sp.]